MNAMKRALFAVCACIALAGSAAAAERFSVTDKGGFGNTGRLVEFANRYAWQSYEIKYEFGLDMESRSLTRKSQLNLTVHRTDGSKWEYRCRASEAGAMWANVNMIYGKGVSVLTECRISPKKFAKAVTLNEELVGEPTLVFHVMIKDGQATAGLHKGFYFTGDSEIAAGGMNQYATEGADPSNLGVLFASAMMPYPHHPYFAATPRFMP